MFRWLFGRNGRAGKEYDQWMPALEKALEDVRALSKPALRLTYTPAAPVPEAPVSSIGGRPSLRSADDWPKDTKGNPMTFLAQLNYSDLPHLDGWPTAGLLSFFVRDEDVFGCNFPSIGGEGYRVLWTDDVSGLTRQDIPEMHEGYSPFERNLERDGAPLTGSLVDSCPPMPSNAVVHTLVPKWPDGFPVDLEDEFAERLMEERPGAIYYGGHPDFTQDDFRYGSNTEYSEVLLQLGMTSPDAEGWGMMFGDAGEAQFMISPECLAARAFEKAVWNWDCC